MSYNIDRVEVLIVINESFSAGPRELKFAYNPEHEDEFAEAALAKYRALYAAEARGGSVSEDDLFIG